MEIYENLSIESLPNEEWRDVVGYEGLYQVSNLGRIKSVSKQKVTPTAIYFTTPKILPQRISKGGYYRVSLCKESHSKYISVHKLVANAFIGDQCDLTINHLNEKKWDNRAENLEYITLSENIRYGTGVKRSSISRKTSEKVKRTPVNQYTLGGVFVARYKSISEAKEINGYRKENISLCCLHKRNQSNGFIWRYDGDHDVSYNIRTKSKPVVQYNMNGDKLNEYSSLEEATKTTGIHKGDICNCCRGKLKHARKYIWRYKDE